MRLYVGIDLHANNHYLEIIDERLLSLPGVGEFVGLTIMLEVGEIGRFREVGNYSSYCRCVRSTRLSNGKSKGEGNRKNGNKYLAWAYAEAANYALRFYPEVSRYYHRKPAQTIIQDSNFRS